MKARKLLTATELVERREYLVRQLDTIGLESQPQVAMKILELNGRPDAQLKDYANVVKTDPALSGRLLRLANSAMFAQRKAVTTVDRACLLLGLERLKAVSLGFQLSRAAAATGQKELTRKVWGQNVFRACVAAECARVIAPSHVSEAFVVGLMIDAGIPLMARFLGDAYIALHDAAPSPGKLYLTEFDQLPYTHVDVMAALAKRWKLPDLLAHPIEWHHTPPADPRRVDPVHRLHRIAYGVGLVAIPDRAADPAAPTPDAGQASLRPLQRLLNVPNEDLDEILQRAVKEYGASSEMFGDIAQSLGNIDELADRVQVELVRALDQLAGAELLNEEEATPHAFPFGGQRVEIELDEARMGIAYLIDSHGEKLVSQRFDPKATTTDALCELLGIEATPDERRPLDDYLRKIAA